MANLSLSMLEIIVLMIGAVFLGITIHFFIISRRNLNNTTSGGQDNNRDLEQWKARYFNDMETKEKELVHLRKRVEEAEQGSQIYSMEVEETRRENKRLLNELDSLKKALPGQGATSFAMQLKLTQESLLEQNDRIAQLLEQISEVKESENKLEGILSENEELSAQVDELRRVAAEKEKELNNLLQKDFLATEMSSLLDNANQDFRLLQEKIRKLESQVNSSKINSLDYENLKEEHHKLSEDLETSRTQLNGMTLQNQQLKLQLGEAENKLREANFQRQQLQKRVSYLEELSKDMQLVAETNKNLQSQMKRIGELESMLSVMAEERNELMRRQANV